MLRTTDGKYVTLSEYLEGAKESHPDTVYYTTDEKLQSQYVSLFTARGMSVAVLDGVVDTRFVETLESYADKDHPVKFVRVDADISALKGEGDATENESLVALFRKVAGKEDLTVAFAPLTEASVPALLSVDESMRRTHDMMRYYMPDMKEEAKTTLTLNTASSVITRLSDGSYGEHTEEIARQVWSLANLAQRQLSAEEMTGFLSDAYALLGLL